MQRMYVDKCLPEMDFLNKVFKHGATYRIHLFKSRLKTLSKVKDINLTKLAPETLVDTIVGRKNPNIR